MSNNRTKSTQPFGQSTSVLGPSKPPADGTSPIARIHDETLKDVFSFLNDLELKKLRSVNKRFNEVATSYFSTDIMTIKTALLYRIAPYRNAIKAIKQTLATKQAQLNEIDQDEIKKAEIKAEIKLLNDQITAIDQKLEYTAKLATPEVETFLLERAGEYYPEFRMAMNSIIQDEKLDEDVRRMLCSVIETAIQQALKGSDIPLQKMANLGELAQLARMYNVLPQDNFSPIQGTADGPLTIAFSYLDDGKENKKLRMLKSVSKQFNKVTNSYFKPEVYAIKARFLEIMQHYKDETVQKTELNGMILKYILEKAKNNYPELLTAVSSLIKGENPSVIGPEKKLEDSDRVMFCSLFEEAARQIFTDVKVMNEGRRRNTLRMVIHLMNDPDQCDREKFRGLFTEVAKQILNFNDPRYGHNMLILLQPLVHLMDDQSLNNSDRTTYRDLVTETVVHILKTGTNLHNADTIIDVLLLSQSLGLQFSGRSISVNLASAKLSGKHLAILARTSFYPLQLNLRRTDLSNACLVGADLFRAILWETNLQGANLQGANLENADLWGANLTGADVTGTIFAFADIAKVNLQGVKGLTNTQLLSTGKKENGDYQYDFSGVIFPDGFPVFYGVSLKNAKFIDTNLRFAVLSHSDLTGAKFSGSLEHANLDHTIISGTTSFSHYTLHNTSLRGVTFDGNNLQGTKFNACDLMGARLQNVTISKSVFADCALKGVEFDSLIGVKHLSREQLSALGSLTNTDLQGIDLTGINFAKKNLSGCRFLNSNLEKADFSGANLAGVIFFDTKLTGALFINTNLQGADLTGAIHLPIDQLSKAQDLRNIKISCNILNANNATLKQFSAIKTKIVKSYEAYFASHTSLNEGSFNALLNELISIIDNDTHPLKILNNFESSVMGFHKYGLTEHCAWAINSGRKRIIQLLKRSSDAVIKDLVENNWHALLKLFSANVCPPGFFQHEQKKCEAEMYNWLVTVRNNILEQRVGQGLQLQHKK